MSTGTASAEQSLGALSDTGTELLKLLLEERARVRREIRPRARNKVTGPIRLPTSWAQERLWFIDQLEGGTAAYNTGLAARLVGVLDFGSLQRALDSLVNRHEVLRTTFVIAQGDPQQEIAENGSFELEMIDLSGHDKAERETQLQDHRIKGAHRKFNLSVGPLVRGRLYRMGADEHVLVILMHHIISDGWSTGILIRELSELYSASVEGRNSRLAPLPIQYADYAQWQRECLHGAEFDRQLSYWRSHLEGGVPQMEWPTDRPRPAVQSNRGEIIKFVLDRQLSAKLRRLAQREEMTLFMVLFAGWSVLLSRVCGQEDISIGTPFANRQLPEIEGLIGFFVNTIVLRVQVRADQSVRDLLARVKGLTLSAYDHSDLPFEQVVEALRPQRSLSYNPVFQVMFSLQSTPKGELRLPGSIVSYEDVVGGPAKFDLDLWLEECGDAIVGNISFSTDLFERRTVERWVACYSVLLREMTEKVSRPVRDLAMLPASEREMIGSFNGMRVADAAVGLIHQQFEEQVRRTPQATAVVCDGNSLTYVELNVRANRLAHYLRCKGVGPDDLVGIYLERSLEMLVSILAVLKSGGAYLPLDTTFPPGRLAYMLRDASPKLILTKERLSGALNGRGRELVFLDERSEEIAELSTKNIDSATSGLCSHHLAYVIYTSGSTGQPKGVMVEHWNVVRLFECTAQWFDFNDDDVWTLFHSVAFDFSVWELWGALLYGGRLVVVPDLIARSPQELYRLLCAERVTILNQTPGAFAQLVGAQAQTSERHSLRLVVFGGEALELRTLHPWVERNGTHMPQLVNMYGITETTVHVTYSPISDQEVWSERGGGIGKPIPDLQVYLLDENRMFVPIGVRGEIYVGGAGLARGYLNRPELTAERFVPNPFSFEPGARLYKTGDLGRWRYDGSVQYLGRNDNQVKIRGYRIELGEIEAQLVRHESVREAVVLVRADAPGEKRLVAYVTEHDRGSVSPEHLRGYLRAAVPGYMVPSAFVILQSLPLTPTGKLDRRGLPAPGCDANVSAAYEAPHGRLEEALASLWRAVLQVERTSRRDNFFDLGGHSLLAVKLVFRINESLPAALKVTDLYKNPTICDLAVRIHEGVISDEQVDLSSEAVLPAEVLGGAQFSCERPKAVLLTGGTGFVGRFLLAQLLQESDAKVYCLIRAPSHKDALCRLRTNMIKWDLWRDDFERRIVAIAGDLRAPCLGVNERTYQMLSESVGIIYHCATSMNHLETYTMAKLANVESVKELVSLATKQTRKLINYVSTLSVFSPLTVDTARVVDELSPIDHEKHPASHGYSASKWVAEKIFMIANERGVPCNIFRLGLVWADTQQGRYDELQREYRILKTCLLSGRGIKNYRYDWAPTPVDYAARAIVFLARAHQDGNGIFHISSSSQLIDEGIFERCNEVVGTSLKLMPLYDWICEIKRLDREGQVLPAVPLIEFAFSMDEEAFYARQGRIRSSTRIIDCAKTYSELERADIVAPKLNDDLLKVCVRSMQRRDADLRDSSELRRALVVDDTQAS